MRIGDLTAPVSAAKSDWLPGSTYLGFTPKDGSLGARASCQSTIQKQFGKGFVLEYVTQKFDEPNPGYENDPRIVQEREAHARVAGKLIAVHRLRASSRPLREIVGADEFEHLQDMWAKREHRHRWSVAFPITQTFEIVDPPYAKTVFGDDGYKSVFAYSSAYLRPLSEGHRRALSDLEIVERAAPSAWIAIEDEFMMAEMGGIPTHTQTLIDRDLGQHAFEGLSEERIVKLKKRAAWLATRYWLKKFKAGEGHCEVCKFDPRTRLDDTRYTLKTALDVHHREPLAEGIRYTTIDDFALLCPTCHRIEHMMLKKGETLLSQRRSN